MQRKGSKKGGGASFCHFCSKQLQYKTGGGFHFKELLTPVDRYPVRLHMQCVDEAVADGYKVPK